MNTLLTKLAELAVGEYKLQKGVKGEIKELEKELACISVALHKVSEVAADQLDDQVKIWACDARQLSYDIEDAVDTFMLRGKQHGHTDSSFSIKKLIGKATDLYKKAKTNHKIHNVIKDIMDQVKKVSERRDRCRVDNIAGARPTIEPVDPRLEATYRKATELVGIGVPKNELAKRILEQDFSLQQQTNIISIVGIGGLGKTTLANSLLQDLKSKFDCHFFVSVSFNPDIKKIFKNILLQLDEKEYSHIDEAWEIKLLIDKIIEFLKNKRGMYLICLKLEDCSGLDENHLKGLSNLYLMKFLRLKGLRVTKLPESIGNLESLETLDIRGCREVIMLPLYFGKLGKLVRLLASIVELPDGVVLENMKSLQELVGIRLTLHAMTEIGKLKELKDFIPEFPSGLQSFMCIVLLPAFPRWIDPSLSRLTILSIRLSGTLDGSS
nr:unnamed protein product [Digitaria exilis]